MLKHRIRKSALHITSRVSGLITLLLKDEAISGKFLLAAAVIAIIVTNTPWNTFYEHIWTRDFAITFGSHGISETVRHWINEGLMAIFFLVISLEIKREIVSGELRRWQAAVLPVAAAIGGALLPIIFYLIFNSGHAGSNGWGVPMTTDTAFSIGLLALLGKRIPLTVKIFLLTATVVDDVAAITAIAAFYNDGIGIIPLAIAGGLLALILILHWIRLLRLTTFVILGLGMWFAIHESGVHASIAGVILGLSAPVVARRTKGAVAERLERSLIPLSTFVVIPLFALANAGVPISLGVFSEPEAARVGIGVAAGLLVGKALGIFGGAWLVVKSRLTRLPEGMGWGHVLGVGLLSGVGFTLSIFIAELAYDERYLVNAAKVSIFAASLISAVLGIILLRLYRYRSLGNSQAKPTVVSPTI